MPRVPNPKLTVRPLILVGIFAATLAVSAGAMAAVRIAHGTFPAGSIRLSSAKNNNFVDVSPTHPVVRVLKTKITVPSGRTADVQASFSATVAHNIDTYAYCFGAFTLDSHTSDSTFEPGAQYQLIGGAGANEPDALTVSMTGFRTDIGAGDHWVNVYITSSYAGCTVEDRALNVVVNIH